MAKRTYFGSVKGRPLVDRTSSGERVFGIHVPVHLMRDRDKLYADAQRLGQYRYRDYNHVPIPYKDETGNEAYIEPVASKPDSEGKYIRQVVSGLTDQMREKAPSAATEIYKALLDAAYPRNLTGDENWNEESALENNFADYPYWKKQFEDSPEDALDAVNDFFTQARNSYVNNNETPTRDEIKTLGVLGRLANDYRGAHQNESDVPYYAPMKELIDYYKHLGDNELVPSPKAPMYEIRRALFQAKPELDAEGKQIGWLPPSDDDKNLSGDNMLNEDVYWFTPKDGLPIDKVAQYIQKGVDSNNADYIPMGNLLPLSQADLDEMNPLRRYMTNETLKSLYDAADTYDAYNENAFKSYNEDVDDIASRQVSGDFVYNTGLDYIKNALENNQDIDLDSDLVGTILNIARNQQASRPKDLGKLTPQQVAEDYVVNKLGRANDAADGFREVANRFIEPSDLTGYPLHDPKLQRSFIRHMTDRVKNRFGDKLKGTNLEKKDDTFDSNGTQMRKLTDKDVSQANKSLRQTIRKILKGGTTLDAELPESGGNIRRSLSFGGDALKSLDDVLASGDYGTPSDELVKQVREALSNIGDVNKASGAKVADVYHRWDMPSRADGYKSLSDEIRSYIDKGVEDGSVSKDDIADQIRAMDEADSDDAVSKWIANFKSTHNIPSFIGRTHSKKDMDAISDWKNKLLAPERHHEPNMEDILAGKFGGKGPEVLDELMSVYTDWLEKSRDARAREVMEQNNYPDNMLDNVKRGLEITDKERVDGMKERALAAYEKRNAPKDTSKKDETDNGPDLIIDEDELDDAVNVSKLLDSMKNGTYDGKAVDSIKVFGPTDIRRLVNLAQDGTSTWQKLSDDELSNAVNRLSKGMTDDEKKGLNELIGTTGSVINTKALQSMLGERSRRDRQEKNQQIQQKLLEMQKNNEFLAEQDAKKKQQFNDEWAAKLKAQADRDRLISAERMSKLDQYLKTMDEAGANTEAASNNLVSTNRGEMNPNERPGTVIRNAGEQETPVNKDFTGRAEFDAFNKASDEEKKQRDEANRAEQNAKKQHEDVAQAKADNAPPSEVKQQQAEANRADKEADKQQAQADAAKKKKVVVRRKAVTPPKGMTSDTEPKVDKTEDGISDAVRNTLVNMHGY